MVFLELLTFSSVFTAFTAFKSDASVNSELCEKPIESSLTTLNPKPFSSSKLAFFILLSSKIKFSLTVFSTNSSPSSYEDKVSSTSLADFSVDQCF